jgi:Rx N-terminal domain
MTSTLLTIDAVLCEAEKRSLKDRAVHIWLKQLKLVSYEIDDLLTDFEIKDPMQTEVVVCDEMLNKVCCFYNVFISFYIYIFCFYSTKNIDNYTPQTFIDWFLEVRLF